MAMPNRKNIYGTMVAVQCPKASSEGSVVLSAAENSLARFRQRTASRWQKNVLAATGIQEMAIIQGHARGSQRFTASIGGRIQKLISRHENSVTRASGSRILRTVRAPSTFW